MSAGITTTTTAELPIAAGEALLGVVTLVRTAEGSIAARWEHTGAAPVPAAQAARVLHTIAGQFEIDALG